MSKPTRKQRSSSLLKAFIRFDRKRQQRIRRRQRLQKRAGQRRSPGRAESDGDEDGQRTVEELLIEMDVELETVDIELKANGFSKMDTTDDEETDSSLFSDSSSSSGSGSESSHSVDSQSSLSSISSTSFSSDFSSTSESSSDDEDLELPNSMPTPPVQHRLRGKRFHCRYRAWVQGSIQKMYSSRYEVPRVRLLKPPPDLPHTLNINKHLYPQKFRESLRISPTTFDKLVAALECDPVFHNDSNNGQLDVETQLAVALYRFGHFGNAASLQGVADWAGLGKGTVQLVTKRMMAAILRSSFRNKHVRMPTPEEKEDAKKWVEAHSCEAWRDGWCLVDGTLIPLAMRPHWYGESYFDRKSNYSLNVQVVSLPNLCIIDFTYGFTGSTHDSTAWDYTRIKQEHADIMEEGEWVWADSAYPIEEWVVAPYKAPYKDTPENGQFNNFVSRVRVRSEHCIGFLKGRFSSLKGLRVNIHDAQSHKFACYWVAACIAVHNFAMEDERADDADIDHNPFIEEGLEDGNAPAPSHRQNHQTAGSGKLKREQLKRQLQKALRRRGRQRQRAEGFQYESSEESE